MKNTIYKVTSEDIYSGSFHNVTINSSLEKLTDLFGSPGPGDGGYKVKHEWVFVGDNGSVVSVYDWKENGAVTHSWNVGGEDKISCLKFLKWFNSL